MRPILVAMLLALTLAAAAVVPAEAGDMRPLTPNHAPAPPARTPSMLRGPDPGIQRFDHDRRDHRDGRRDHRREDHDRRGDHWGWRHHPRGGVVFLAPSGCWQPGYWTYQWVPQTYSYSTWVSGHWSPDGRWIEGHYAPAYYPSGYYQPYWVAGYWTAC